MKEDTIKTIIVLVGLSLFGLFAYFLPIRFPLIGVNRTVSFFVISILFCCYLMKKEYEEWKDGKVS